MTGKLTKEELEGPDAFQSTVELITDYIAENKKRFYSIVTAVVVAVIIALGIYIYWDNYQTSARENYAKAQKISATGVETPEMAQQQIKAYQELIAKYPHSWSARMAHYHLGNIYYNAGNYDNAINDYKKFVASRISDNAGIKFLALTSIGYCYEAKKDFKSALEYFEKAQKGNNVGFESVGYGNIGRIYEQMNDKKSALDHYKKALEKSTDPAKAVLIKYKISSLS
jgi:predicted negative regulator of RcsB-dependent stress response